MKLAFVIQRYGEEVLGGAESLTRQVAEKLALSWPVEILTTCALEFTTWANYYPVGRAYINGVPVQRFPLEQPRHPEFDQIHATLINNSQATILDEIEWLKAQGPYSPQLLCYLSEHYSDYDLLIFVGYLYFHTYFGLQVAPHRSVLIPTLHDELPLRFSIYNTVFSLPQGLIFLTPEEQQLAHHRFAITRTPQTVIGGEVAIPTDVNCKDFCDKYRLERPFILYAGRIDHSKQCDQLFLWFSRFRRERNLAVELALIGQLKMPLPTDEGIHYLGMMSEAEKFSAMIAAQVFIMPSIYESFSIVSLEALGVGTPLLANEVGEVVRGHCLRSNGGLLYNSYEEFSECLSLLLAREDLRKRLGKNGQKYVQENYHAEVVRQKYIQFLSTIAHRVGL
jgi:glycosyltransferase involved in cell wall biosynthesis